MWSSLGDSSGTGCCCVIGACLHLVKQFICSGLSLLLPVQQYSFFKAITWLLVLIKACSQSRMVFRSAFLHCPFVPPAPGVSQLLQVLYSGVSAFTVMPDVQFCLKRPDLFPVLSCPTTSKDKRLRCSNSFCCVDTTRLIVTGWVWSGQSELLFELSGPEFGVWFARLVKVQRALLLSRRHS